VDFMPCLFKIDSQKAMDFFCTKMPHQMQLPEKFVLQFIHCLCQSPNQ
jgi:hypothetical protein